MSDTKSVLPLDPFSSNNELLILARHVQRTRLRANAVFGSRILCDPRYEMLLELYIAHHEGRDVSVSDLSVAASVPPTTGLRQLERLEEEGFVHREPDLKDRRRSWVRPTRKVLDDFRTLLTQLNQAYERS